MDGYAVIIDTITDRDLGSRQLEAVGLTIGKGVTSYDSAARSLRFTLPVDASAMPDAIAQALADLDRAAAAAGFAYAERDELRVLPHDRFEAETLRPPAPRGGLAGMAEAAGILGVSRQRVAEIRKSHPEFPRPLEDLAATPVWDRAEIEAFNQRWDRKRTGRPRKAGVDGEA